MLAGALFLATLHVCVDGYVILNASDVYQTWSKQYRSIGGPTGQYAPGTNARNIDNGTRTAFVATALDDGTCRLP